MSTRKVRGNKNRKRKQADPHISSDNEIEIIEQPPCKRQKLDEHDTKSTKSPKNEKKEPNVRSNTLCDELVVDGYIRSVNTTLFQNMIPNAINKLCFLYQRSFHKFGIVCHVRDTNKTWNLALIDIQGEHKQKYTISPSKLKYDENDRPNPILHIENICNHLPSNMTNNNHKLNAIFGVTNFKPENAVNYDNEPVTVDKEMIINKLMEYAQMETNSFKRNAYKKACNSIRRTSKKPSEYYSLSGVGQSISAKIAAIIENPPRRRVKVTGEYSYLVLYDPFDFSVKYEYVSRYPLKFDYCPTKFLQFPDGIFCEFGGLIYKMEWNEIRTKDDFGRFIKLKGISLKDKISNSVAYTTPYFRMCYLNDMNRVFIMRCNSCNDDWVEYRATKAYGGLLNISTKYWKSISPLNHGRLEAQTWFDGIMVYDGNKCVYVKDGNKLSKYDLKSKRWSKNINTNAPYTYVYDEIMWIDNDAKDNVKTIYVLRSNDSDQGKNQLYSLRIDGVTVDKKWNVWQF